MNITELEYTVKYDKELQFFQNFVFFSDDFIFNSSYSVNHNKENFLEKNNLTICPNIAKTIIFYLFYNENKKEFKFLLNKICQNQTKISSINLGYIFQFFKLNYVVDLTDLQKCQAKNKFLYYIKYIVLNFLQANKNKDFIYYLFLNISLIYEKENWLTNKLFLKLIIEYFDFWKYLTKDQINTILEQLLLKNYFTNQTNFYYIKQYALNKEKLIELFNKNMF